MIRFPSKIIKILKYWKCVQDSLDNQLPPPIPLKLKVMWLELRLRFKYQLQEYWWEEGIDPLGLKLFVLH